MDNKQIRDMALARLMAIPRVMIHPSGKCINHPDGDMLHAAYTIQQAMKIIDDVMLFCASLPTDTPPQ